MRQTLLLGFNFTKLSCHAYHDRAVDVHDLIVLVLQYDLVASAFGSRIDSQVLEVVIDLPAERYEPHEVLRERAVELCFCQGPEI